MADSTLKLYKDLQVTPDRNFMVDDFTEYLQRNSTGALTANNFQYIKHGLEISIKIDTKIFGTTSEAMLDPANTTYNFNYCSIKNSSDTNPFYYFIISKEWYSNNTVYFNLKLDTLNTFKLGTDYDFTNRTKVSREHKDRIYASNITVDGKTYYRRKIDFNSEGITPVLYKDSEKIVYDPDSQQDWYILYMASNTQQAQFPPQPVYTYIIPSVQTLIATITGDQFNISAGDIEVGQYYFFGRNVTGPGWTERTGIVSIVGEPYDWKDVGEYGYINKDDQGTYHIFYATGRRRYIGVPGSYVAVNEFIEIANSTTVANFYFKSNDIVCKVSSAAYTTIIKGQYSDMARHINESTTQTLRPTSTSDRTLHGIDDITTVDRTDTRILKLIKLPYAPISIEYDNQTGAVLIPDNTIYDNVNWGTEQDPIIKHYLRYSDVTLSAFENNIVTELPIFRNLFTTFAEGDLRDDENESKLFHSDYYQNKFVYDSFAYPIQYENISQATLESITWDSTLRLNFVLTSTTNSRFLFDLKDIADYRSTSDYDHILVVDRNNEVPVFNSEYINYIKNGYNYDKKAKNMAIMQSAFGIAGNVATLATGAINLGGATTGLAAVQSGGMVVSGISGIASNISNIINAEQQFARKQEEMRMSSVSVSGSDDIDLLSYYSFNKAKICEYNVSDIMKDSLADLFYYYGYSTNEQKKPETHTRHWFNYLKCEADLDNIRDVQQIYLDDIANKFNDGVTIIHAVTQSSIKFWDLVQRHANNEIWLNV